jgi:hypothetical protein
MFCYPADHLKHKVKVCYPNALMKVDHERPVTQKKAIQAKKHAGETESRKAKGNPVHLDDNESEDAMTKLAAAAPVATVATPVKRQ